MYLSKTERKMTSHVTFFKAVNEVRSTPNEYDTLTYPQISKKLSDKVGGHVADTRIKDIFKCAGVQHKPARTQGTINNGSHQKIRELSRALCRTLRAAGFEGEIDPLIIKYAQEDDE